MTPVVALHGFLGGPSSFDAVRRVLGSRVPLTTPFLPGHGPTAPARDWDDTVDAIVREVAVGPAVWVGYSLGGRLALGVATRHPASVRALVLVSADWGIRALDERIVRAGRDEERARAVETTGLDAFVADWEREPVFSTQTEEQIAAQRPLRVAHDPSGVAWALRALGPASMPDLGDALVEPRVPVIYLAGARDSRYADRAAELVRAGSVDVRVVVGVGHNLLIEAPTEVALAIEDAVSRVRPVPVPASTRTPVGEET